MENIADKNIDNMNKKNQLISIIDNLTESLSQISVGIREVNTGVQDLAIMNNQLLQETKEANNNAKDTDQIVGIIQGIS